MPKLDVTEEQLERLEALRAELEAAFVGGYAHVRRRDAVDYLLDTYPPPADRAGENGGGVGATDDDDGTVEERVRAALGREVCDEEGDIDYPSLQSVAREIDGVKGSGMGAEEMYEAVVEAKVREVETGETDGVEIPATNGAEAEDCDGTDVGPADSDTAAGDSAAAPDEPDGYESEGAGGDGANEGNDGESESGDTASASAGIGGGGGSGSQLQRMMNLLETHDDRWRKVENGDAPYEVDLPDGGTEAVRTKDDVKRVLFTNY